MGTYEFSLTSAKSMQHEILTLDLQSHVAASVKAFDILRDDPSLSSVRVATTGRALFSRTRMEGKTILKWSR